MRPACTEIVSLCQGAWRWTLGKPAHDETNCPTPHTQSVSTQQRGQQLNVSEFNRCHLSQIKEDRRTLYVCLSGNLIL